MTEPARKSTGRVELLDLARGVALLAMLVYHFTWDLEFFGYLPPGYAQVGGWRLFARAIASSFLILAGISLVLAHVDGVRWPSFRKRLLQIAAGAAAITIATYLLTPAGFVFFGILHLIAWGSIVGLLFLRLPFVVVLASAVAVIAAPNFVSTEVTDSRWLAWIGFSANPPLSNDFVPIFPWFGPILIGIALGQAFARYGVWRRLRTWNETTRPVQPLAVLGRHSLMFYLLHQPVSFGLVAAAAFIFPPDQTAHFRQSCQATCENDRDAAFCTNYCGCVETRLTSQQLLEKLLQDRLTETERSSVEETVSYCSFAPAEQP